MGAASALEGTVSERYLRGMLGAEGAEAPCSSLADECKTELDERGVVTLHDFLTPAAVAELVAEAESRAPEAFYTSSTHNVWLTEPDASRPPGHIFNRQLQSGKGACAARCPPRWRRRSSRTSADDDRDVGPHSGCIQHDQIPPGSRLRALYDDRSFRRFIAKVVGEKELHEYADTLSGINVHYAGDSKNLNWHFDNSSFAITLLLQSPEGGGLFQYVSLAPSLPPSLTHSLTHSLARSLARSLAPSRYVANTRREDEEEEHALVESIVDGEVEPTTLSMRPGTLVLFRGRDSIHRVTPTEGDRQRILVVLAFNAEEGIALSEKARMTFFGRLA